jgi:hypothetical protein
MSHSEFMDQFVYDLIEHYEADVLPSGLLYLELRREGHGILIIEETLKHQEMHVRYQLFDAEGKPVPEPEVVFYIAPDGHWIPFAIYRISAGGWTFADLDPERGDLVITDPKNQASLAYFANFWAEALRAQGWTKFATKHHGEPWQIATPEEILSNQPPIEALWDWVDEYGKCTATDGCWVDPAGVCEHGRKSWLVELGLMVAENRPAAPEGY